MAKAKRKQAELPGPQEAVIDMTPERVVNDDDIEYADSHDIAISGGLSSAKGGVSPMCSRCEHWVESDPAWKLVDGKVVCSVCQTKPWPS